MESYKFYHFFFSIIAILFWISLIILMAGSAKIKNKKNSGTLFITQMPYEILSNHRIPVIYDVKVQRTCPSNYFKLNLRLKLDSYYDCTHKKKKELYKNYCQNNIVSNITCCENKCCSKIKYSKNKFYACSDLSLDSNDTLNYVKNNDPRSKYCEYFNKYNGDIFSLFNNSLCVPNLTEFKNEFPPIRKYKELSIYAKPPGTKYCGIDLKPCGILDTFGNILCLPKNYKCPLNSIIVSSSNDSFLLQNYDEYKINETSSIYFGYLESVTNKIIVENYISEIPILSHEWNKLQTDKSQFPHIKQFNKIKYKYDKYSSTVKNDITNSDNFCNVENIIGWNKQNCDFLNKYNSHNINLKQDLKWYIKSYIGVNLNEKSYNDIMAIFDSDERKNNKFYRKYYSKLQPGLETLACTAFFGCCYLIIIIFLPPIITYKDETCFKIATTVLYIFQIVFEFIYFVTFSVKLAEYNKIEKIKKDFDEQVVDLFSTYVLIIGEIKGFYCLCVIIFIIHVILFIIYFLWKDGFKEILEGCCDCIWDPIGDCCDCFWESIDKYFTSFKNSIINCCPSFWDSIKKCFLFFKKSIGPCCIKFWKSIKDCCSSSWGKIEPYCCCICNKIKKCLKNRKGREDKREEIRKKIEAENPRYREANANNKVLKKKVEEADIEKEIRREVEAKTIRFESENERMKYYLQNGSKTNK